MRERACVSESVDNYRLLHLKSHWILTWIPNLNLIGLFSTERGKRNLENSIVEWDSRFEEMTLQMQ